MKTKGLGFSSKQWKNKRFRLFFKTMKKEEVENKSRRRPWRRRKKTQATDFNQLLKRTNPEDTIFITKNLKKINLSWKKEEGTHKN